MRRTARLRRDEASLHERLKSAQYFLSIAGLGSIPRSPEDQYPPGRHAFSALPNQPCLGLVIERPRTWNVKSKLHGSGDLVYILAARAG